MENVNNMPEYAKTKKYIVASDINGELWFWGAWDDENTANRIACEIGGITLENE